MKALTICQPYAELILRGEKIVENRTWQTGYRGALAIHAGKARNWLSLGHGDLVDILYDIPVAAMAFGAIVGRCTLLGCVQSDHILAGKYDSTWRGISTHRHVSGPWCWVLGGVERFERPIPYKGALALFEIPDAVLKGAA